MLASDKIAGAFLAIIEEAEKRLEKSSSPDAEEELKRIISIAKHQSDIRNVTSGKCAAHSRCVK